MLDYVHGRGERHGRGDDFVARPDARAHERGVQGRRARAHGQRTGRLQVGREVGLELASLRAGRDPTGTEGVHHLGDFFFADQRWCERQELAPPGWSAVNTYRWYANHVAPI